MTEIESYELLNSMEKEIEKRIEKAKEYLEKKQEKLKDKTGKLGMFDKLEITSSIKSYQEQIRKLTELNQSLAKFRFSDADKYQLPTELNENFDRLGALLSEEETKQLAKNINECLKNANKEKKEQIQQEVIKIHKILNQLKIGDNEFLIYNKFNQFTGSAKSFNQALNQGEKLQLRDLTPEYLFKKNNSTEIKLDISDELLLSSLEKMINNNQLEKNKGTQNIINNFNSIKKAFNAKTKLDEILLVLSNTLLETQKLTEVDFTKVNLYLKQLEKNYKKELEKTNKYLSQFDFSNIKKQIDERRVQEEKDGLEKSNIIRYTQLVYELEKVMVENPNNYEKIQKLKENMREVAITSGLTNEQLQAAQIEGKTKYQREMQEQKVKVEVAKETISYEEQLKADVMKAIREYAIQELEASGAFQENYEFKNGDAYSQSMDRETIIKRKIEELKKIADMTPEERGLEDQKRRGIISFDTRLEDLSPQQINDFRIGYGNSSYEFMNDYKKWQAREKIKPKANNIYREYIKYRASLKDKTQFLSFSDYAKQIHNIENISESMVDVDLKEETKDKTR